MTELTLESKQRFDHFYPTDIIVAKISAALYVESLELHTLDPDQEIQRLERECELSNQEIDAFPRKEYLDFGPSESRHYNTFFIHYIFDHSIEESEIFKGLFLSEKNKQLRHHYKKSKFRLSPFTFLKFIRNEWNVVFYVLNQKPPRTSKEDYFKMRCWQIHRKTDCVNLLLDQFIERFNKEADTPDSIKKHAREELLLLEELRQAKQYTTGQFMDKFMQLRAIAPDSLPENETEFHQLYCQFLQGHDFSPTLTPQMLRSALKLVRSGKLPPVPLCNWALIKYKKWLTCLLEGKLELKDPLGFSCEQLYEKTNEEGHDQHQSYIEEFKNKYPSGSVTDKKYKSILLREVNQLRLRFNNLNYTDYYPFLEKKETAKSYFINNCFLDIDMENHTGELREAVFINETLQFLKDELFQIDESLIKPFRTMTELQKQFADLISLMVPTPTLMNQLWMIYKRTLLAFSAGKPFLFIVEDLKESICNLFNQAWKNLNNLLNSKPGNLTAIYAIKQIADLQLRALTVQDNDLNLNECFDKVKKLFEIKLWCIKEMGNLNSNEINIRTQETEIQVIKNENNIILAFNYNNTKGDNLSAVHKLLIHLKAIPPETTVHELREFVNGKEMVNPIKWLAGLGDLMVFIKEATSNGKLTFPYQQQWNIAVKCFVKPDGSKFNATSLKVSIPTENAAKFIKAAQLF